VYDYTPTFSDVFNEDTCQKIEEKTHAVLIRDGDCRLIIQGSDQLHVLLAVSVVEDIVARVETNVSSSSGHNSSAMLDKMLKRAYSHEGEAEDGFDWSTMPEEVKRSVLVSLLDSDEPEVTIVGTEGIVDESSKSPATTAAAVSSFAGTSNAAAPAVVSNTLSPATVSKVPVVELDSPRLDITNPAIQPLVKLALSKGYCVDEIEIVLHKTSQLKESEFLRILHTNRRLQSATSQPASVTVNSASSAHSVTGSKNIHLQGVGTHSMKGADSENVGRCVGGSNYIVIDESVMEVSPAGGNDSVILLKSDDEKEGSDDDDKNMEVEIPVHNDAPLKNREVGSDEQSRKTAAVELGVGTRRKKKKRKKKQLSPVTTMNQKEEPPPTSRTGNDIGDLDCISLIPAARTTAADKFSTVVFVTDSSDSEVMDISQDIDSRKPAVDLNEQHQFAAHKEESRLFSHTRSGGVSSNTFGNENIQCSRQSNIAAPAPAFTSVSAVATGVVLKCTIILLCIRAVA